MMKFSDIIEDEVGRHVGYAINLVLYFPFLLSIIYIKELFNFITNQNIAISLLLFSLQAD